MGRRTVFPGQESKKPYLKNNLKPKGLEVWLKC
jgi:hypothetical protein